MLLREAALDMLAPKAVPNARSLSQATHSIEAVTTLLELRPPLDQASRQVILADGITRDEVAPIAQEISAHNEEVVADHFDAATVLECTQVIAALEPVLESVNALERQLRDELARHKAIVGVQCRGLYNYLRAIAPTPRGQAIREPLDRWIAAMKNRRSAKAHPSLGTLPAAQPPIASGPTPK